MSDSREIVCSVCGAEWTENVDEGSMNVGQWCPLDRCSGVLHSDDDDDEPYAEDLLEQGDYL